MSCFWTRYKCTEAYLRASNYYRVAEFLLIDPEDPRIQTTWGMSKQCFAEVAKLFSPRFEPVQIPYEETSLPGYLYRVDEKKYANRSRPILIVHGGFDSTLEELYTSAAPALDRRYNCLTFEGPG